MRSSIHAGRASLLFFALFALLAVSARASTVTLTGSCPAQTVSPAHNVFVFNLTNSGDGAASNFYLIPELSGASTFNSFMLLPVIAPGSQYSESFYLYNFSMPGSYIEYFLANYTQDSENFSTFFQCALYVNRSSQSAVRITAINQSKGAVNVLLFNYNNMTINATVHVQAPASFALSDPNASVVMGPHDKKSLSFNVSIPKYSAAAFPIGVAVAYVSNGVHYATIAQTAISFDSVRTSSGLKFTTIIMAAVIAALLFLIVVSVVKKRGHAAEQVIE